MKICGIIEAMKARMPEQDEMLTMRQVSELLGVKSQVLRRYCNRGFVPGAVRIRPGRRRMFTKEQVDYLGLALFLTRAGFTTKDLRKYVAFSRDGGAVADRERKAMLATHKRQIWQELKNLQETIDFIERQEELL